MRKILRNSLAVLLGWFGGSVVNMTLVQTGHRLFPLENIDMNDMLALSEVLPTLAPQYFIFPFLAHALGTLLGAFIAGMVVVTRRMQFSMAIGGLFLLGGIAVNYLLPGPIWFAAIDILLAYIPMAYFGGKLALKLRANKIDV